LKLEARKFDGKGKEEKEEKKKDEKKKEEEVGIFLPTSSTYRLSGNRLSA